MKKNILTKLIVSLIAVIGFVACSDDEPQKIALQLPEADFSYEMFDTRVVFTDKSQNAESHYWTFGDGTTSTEQNPTHTYTTASRFNAELTITGYNGKTDSKRVSIDLSDGNTPEPTEDVNITLDGNFDDWDEVPETRLASAVQADYITGQTALLEVKVCGNEDYLFFYFKAYKDQFDVFQIYIDKDNTDETGFLGWNWSGIGTEYLFEAGEWDDFAPTVFEYIDEDSNGGTEWNWNELFTPDMSIMNFSPMIETGDIVEFEASLPRMYVPDLGRTIKVGISLSKDWATSGSLPSPLEDGTLTAPMTLRIPTN